MASGRPAALRFRSWRRRRGALALLTLFSLFLALPQEGSATVYLVPGLHSNNERYGVIAREQPPSGETGALREIKRSRLDVVRMPVSKVVASARAKQSPDSITECSSLLGPFCFQSFAEGLTLSQFRPPFSPHGVHEVSEESLQLTILSSPGDVLIFLYNGHETPETLELRKHFAKAGAYLKDQIDVAAIDCGEAAAKSHADGGVYTYCREAREAVAAGGAMGQLKHFRRLSDNFYTIHSKVVTSRDDLSIHATIDFLRGPAAMDSNSAEEDPRKKIQHSLKRMLVIRNRSAYSLTISWQQEEGNERMYYELLPGASQLVNVFVSQKWVVREKTTRALAREIAVAEDMSLGGVALHIVTDEMVRKGILKEHEAKMDEVKARKKEKLSSSWR